MIDKKTIEAICAQTIIANREQFSGLRERWLKLLGRYENKLREGSISSDTESKIALGGAFALVENAIPRIFNRQPIYKYLGREGKDGQEAEAYNEFASYQWDEAQAKRKIKKIARWALATGLSGWKMGWKEEKIITKKNGKEVLGIQISNPLMLEALEKLKAGKNIKIDEEQTTSNYTIQAIKPFDLIWSVSAEELEDVRVFGHGGIMKRVSELKAEGYDTKNLVAFIKNTPQWIAKIAQLDNISPYQANNIVGDESVEICELYTRVLNADNIYEYHIVTMASTEQGEPQTIRFEKNTLDKQFIPMGIFRPIDRLGKFYGYGLIEPSTGILDAEEDTLNMSMEALWTDISKPMEYNPQNLLDIQSLEYRPRTLVPVRNLGQSVKVMETPQLPVGSVQYVQTFLQQSKQNVSGITDFQTGAEQAQGGKTLGEVRIKTQESNARIAMIVEAFEEQVLEPIGKYALWMNQQFLADAKAKYYYRVVGKKGEFTEKNIKSKDIQAIKDIVVVSGSSMMIDQQAELTKWNALLNASYGEAKMPEPVPIDREAIWERLLSQGMLISDVETFLPNAREREEEEVGGMQANLKDAKDENANPITARVLPTDRPEIHMPIHKAEIQVREKEVQQTQDPRQIEELQILVQHLNDHSTQAGGQVPASSQQMQVGQGIEANPPMQQQ